jgi:hypothetical protein
MTREFNFQYGPLPCSNSCDHKCQCGSGIKIDERCRKEILKIIGQLQSKCGRNFLYDLDSPANGRDVFNGVTIIDSVKFANGQYSILSAAARIRGGWITFNENEIQLKSQS